MDGSDYEANVKLLISQPTRQTKHGPWIQNFDCVRSLPDQLFRPSLIMNNGWAGA